MIEIRKCTYDEVTDAPNFTALAQEYASESSIEGLGEAVPQREIYAMLERSGMLHTLVAFNQTEIVGFISLLVSMSPHYGKRTAVCESFFVTEAHRKSGVGLRLLRKAEALGKELGAVGMLVTAPTGGILERVLPRVDYAPSHSVFFKAL